MSNTEEPFFIIESLDTLMLADANGDDRAFKAVIFAVNQKGRSPRIVLKDFVVGDTNQSHAGISIRIFYQTKNLRLITDDFARSHRRKLIPIVTDNNRYILDAIDIVLLCGHPNIQQKTNKNHRNTGQFKAIQQFAV